MMTVRSTKICFVALYAYPLFNRNTAYIFGGSEVRSWLLGVGLSKQSENEVSFVVFDHRQPGVEHYGQVTVYAHAGYKADNQAGLIARYRDSVHEAIARTDRFPYLALKKKHPAIFLKAVVLAANRLWRTIWSRLKPLLTRKAVSLLYINGYAVDPMRLTTYREVNADVYCVFGVSNLAAEVAMYCKRAGKKFVIFAGSDADFSAHYRAGAHERNVYGSLAHLCHYAIMQADLIFTQTKSQARLLRDRFGKSSCTICSPIDLGDRIQNPTPYQARKIALWVGKSNAVKRPDILLQLAAAFPDVHFVMVMNRADRTVFERVLRDKTANVAVYESVPFDAIETFFAEAFVLINTSIVEGFPNTFLQAGKYAVPVLSLQVDPDGFIEARECGIVAHGDFNRLVDGMAAIRADQRGAQRLSQNMLAYVTTHHDLDDKIRQVGMAIKEVLQHG